MNQNQRREYLRARDLEMSKQMEKTIKDAQPKPIPDMKLKLLKPIRINTDLITGTPQYKAEKQLSDLLLAQQIENTVKLAMYAVEGKTSEASKSSVTQEMIDDYKKEMMKPVDIGGKKFLFNPVDMPKLPEPFSPKPLTNPKVSEEDYINRRSAILSFIETRQKDLEKLESEKQVLEDRYASSGPVATVVYDEASRKADLSDKANFTYDALKKILNKDLATTLPKSRKREDLVDKIVFLEKMTSLKTTFDVDTLLPEKKLMIAEAQKEIKNAIDDYNKTEGEYKVQLEEMENNRLKELEYNNGKRQLTEEILNDFNRLNQGKGTITRGAQETDDDFYDRLKILGAIPVDQKDIDKQVQTEIMMKAKKNISELTNDLSRAETVVKMLNNEERFLMNKTFPRIKKQYIETFGINNKDIDANEMSQFIKNELDSGLELTSPPEEGSKLDLNKKVRIFSKDQLMAVIKIFNEKDISLNLLTGMEKFQKIEMVKELEANNLFDPKGIRVLLKLPPVDDAMFPSTPTKAPSFGGEAETKDDDEEEEVDDEEEPVVTVGGGLKSHVLPSTISFGKIALDLNKLYYQNILSIKRQNGNKIIGHKNKRVSDNFVDIILKMFENKPISQSDLRNIKDEQMLYDNLIVQSGLHKSKKFPTNIEQTSEQMKNRLGLITGEIEAGNSNKSLLSELHELLFKMVRIHLISKNGATAYYKNIKSQFFDL